ncbi:MAG: hypothetical protein CHACPFDD_02958 [Phycisphaerae bacterium]|nr:hypothetical protein [Phycisphaerae bacterium]
MVKPTKYCDLEVVLLNGLRLKGRFHVDASISSLIRPSDAIRSHREDYLLMSHVGFSDGQQSYERDCVLVRTSNITHIELTGARWISSPA